MEEESSAVVESLPQKNPPWIHTLPNLRKIDSCSSTVASHHPRGYEPNVPVPGNLLLLQGSDTDHGESDGICSSDRMNGFLINGKDSKPADVKYLEIGYNSSEGSSSSSGFKYSPLSMTTTTSKSRLKKDLEELEKLMELEELPIFPEFEEGNKSCKNYDDGRESEQVGGSCKGHSRGREDNEGNNLRGGKKRITFADDVIKYKNAPGFCVARPAFRGFAKILQAERKKREDQEIDEQWTKRAQQTAVYAAAGAVMGAAVGGPMGAYAGAKAAAVGTAFGATTSIIARKVKDSDACGLRRRDVEYTEITEAC
mmetsp:Transcript_26596/g.37113  ORF Transcript_26596/g.37113 Transcript_26596/m.37113 type:complete len:312 (+) Transcript_26596:1-936(+)